MRVYIYIYIYIYMYNAASIHACACVYVWRRSQVVYPSPSNPRSFMTEEPCVGFYSQWR